MVGSWGARELKCGGQLGCQGVEVRWCCIPFWVQSNVEDIYNKIDETLDDCDDLVDSTALLTAKVEALDRKLEGTTKQLSHVMTVTERLERMLVRYIHTYNLEHHADEGSSQVPAARPLDFSHTVNPPAVYAVCSARTRQGETGRFCDSWQYSCLHRPYYTPTMLDSLITQSGFFSS